MNDGLKARILNSMKDILQENKHNVQNTMDIFNIVKVIENYEEFQPKIKEMLNDKARKDKWSER